MADVKRITLPRSMFNLIERLHTTAFIGGLAAATERCLTTCRTWEHPPTDADHTKTASWREVPIVTAEGGLVRRFVCARCHDNHRRYYTRPHQEHRP